MKRTLFAAATFVISLGTLHASDPAAAKQLQNAIGLIDSRGDAKAAAALLEQVARSSDRDLAARALFQLADLQERLGSDRARAIYQRIVTQFSAQREIVIQAQQRLTRLEGPPATKVAANRAVAEGADADPIAYLTADGRFLARPDWDSGDVVVRDMRAGQSRRLMATANDRLDFDAFTEEARVSPDGGSVAYVWYNGDSYQLRLMPNEVGGRSIVLVDNPEYTYFSLVGWAPGSRRLLVTASTANAGESRLIWVSVDGKVTPLKDLGARAGRGSSSLSPDGRYVAYPRLAVEPTRNAQGRWTRNFTQQHIYVLPTDGSGAETLIVGGANINESPVWTPDGQRLLFVSNRDSAYGLWSIRVRDGKPVGNESYVTASLPGRIQPIGMSTNGTLYYVPARDSAARVLGADLKIADFDTRTGRVIGEPRRLLDSRVDSNRAPSWSPDGGRIAFLRRTPQNDLPNQPGEQYEVVVRTLSTGEEKTHFETFVSTTPPIWFHDGTSILFKRDYNGGQLYRWDGVNEPRTVDSIAHAMLPSGWRSAALSVDDRTLYLMVVGPDQPAQTPAGPGPRAARAKVLAFDLADGARSRTIWVAPDPMCGNDTGVTCHPVVPTLSISPDGRSLAMVLQRRDWKSARIALISVDGTNYRELATDVVRTPTLEWTPDGRGLLAVQQRGDGKELVQVRLDGSAPRPTGLALREPEMHSFDLTPEGRLIFSDRTRDDVAGKLWAYDNILSLLP